MQLKQEKPFCGAPKILRLPARRPPGIHRPTVSTTHAVLDWHGLVNIMAYDLGDFGDMGCRLESSDNLFWAKHVIHVPRTICRLLSGRKLFSPALLG